MLSPKRTKYRKAHKGRIHGLAKGGTLLNFGTFGLKAMEPERITARQIEAARRAITRSMKRAGRVWIRIFPDVPVSQKPAEVRMGSGKGSPEFWVARVKPGASCSRSRACRRSWRGRRWHWVRRSCRSRRSSSPALGRREMTKAADIRAKTADELGTMLLDLRKEQFNLRFQKATGQNEGVSRVQKVRRDIARVKTIMGEQKRSAAQTATKS